MRSRNKTDVRLWIALWFALPIYFLCRLYFVHEHLHIPLGVWTVVRGVAPLIAIAIPASYLAKSIQRLKSAQRTEAEIRVRNFQGVALVFLAFVIWMAIRFLTPSGPHL